jgi:hypothetical protein
VPQPHAVQLLEISSATNAMTNVLRAVAKAT